jgi:hypothetical protein
MDIRSKAQNYWNELLELFLTHGDKPKLQAVSGECSKRIIPPQD